MRRCAIGVAVAFAAIACSSKGSTGDRPAAPRYELDCDSSDTKVQSQLFCVRTDTRTGDIRVVELKKLPVTSGPTAAAAAADGRYATVCDSTDTPEASTFRCVRLDTHSGELVMVRLGELPVVPE